MNRVDITEEAWEDINNLPEHLQEECLDTLERLEQGIIRGHPLDKKGHRDLRGCFKLYFNNAKHRIVYTKKENFIIIDEIHPDKWKTSLDYFK